MTTTTVRLLLRSTTPSCRVRVAGRMLAAIVILTALSAAPVGAEGPTMHWQHAGMMPPGAIGSQRLGRGGPLSGYFQPVALHGPKGAVVAWPAGCQFGPDQSMPVTLGMRIAPVYRLRVSNIPNHPGAEVFPTVEVIDRLYPPEGQALRFPIPVVLTQEELEMALDGSYVTRVIYLEDPDQALPHAQVDGQQNYFEVVAGDDPLASADRLGRPVAILRIGGRMPGPEGPDMQFLAGSPPVMAYAPPPKRPPVPRPFAAGHISTRHQPKPTSRPRNNEQIDSDR
jgi:hypothetical protein